MMSKENKKYAFKLIKKNDEKLEDIVEARTLEEAVIIVDNTYCLGMYKDFNICEVKE